jgi:hypothetical protein
MKFIKHSDNCWYAFANCFAVETTGLQEGFVRVDGDIVDMNDEEECSAYISGTISFDDGAVWSSNINNYAPGLYLTVADLREIADFMSSLRMPRDLEFAELGLA